MGAKRSTRPANLGQIVGEKGGFDAAADVGEDDAGAGGVAVGEADDAGDETLGGALDFEDGRVSGSDGFGGELERRGVAGAFDGADQAFAGEVGNDGVGGDDAGVAFGIDDEVF